MLCVSLYVGDAVTNKSLRFSESVTEMLISPPRKSKARAEGSKNSVKETHESTIIDNLKISNILQAAEVIAII